MREDFLQLRRDLRGLSAKKRIDKIIERKDALKVVRALPVQDIYATIREVGVEDALEVLELCSPRQVQGFLDLDGWRGDRIDSTAMTTWLRALVAANPDRAVGQLRGLDIELLTLLVKLHCRVYDLSQEEEPEDEVGLHSITPDNRYLIVFGGVGDDERMQQTLKDVLDRLMSRDILFVLRLCEAARWDLPSSLEEESFKWRNARMADLGFIPRHDALEVFTWRDPDAPLEATPVRPPPTAADDSEVPSTDLSTSPLFPWDSLKDGAAAFATAMRDVPENVREQVAHQVMLTSNRVHSADGGDAGDPEALRATAKQVIDTVGVALSYRCGGDPAKLSPLLLSTSVLTLFRVGHSLSLKLQRELKARIAARDSGLAGNGVLRLDSPLREAAAGLLRPRPLLYSGLLDKKRVDYRPASSLVELAALSRAVAEIGFRGALLGPRGLGATDHAVAQHVADVADQPSHGAILGAALAAAVVGTTAATSGAAAVVDTTTAASGTAAVVDTTAATSGAAAVVDTTGAPRFEAAPFAGDLASLRKALADKAARDRAVSAFLEKAKAWAPLPGAPSADDVVTRARTYANQVLDAVSDELAAVLDHDPDKRFLASLWVAAR